MTVMAAAATTANPGMAFARGVDVKDGHSVVAIRFVDRCDGGTDVQTPNPYNDGSLAFTVNAVIIVVEPGEQPWHAVPAPGSDLELVVKVSVRNPAGTNEKTTHRWSRPKSCTTEQDPPVDSDGDQNANDGYGDDGYGDAVDPGDGDGAATAPADGDVGMSATDQSAASTGLVGGEDGSDESAGSLALTGTNIWMLGGTGLMLVALGLILLLLRNRKVRFEAP